MQTISLKNDKNRTDVFIVIALIFSIAFLTSVTVKPSSSNERSTAFIEENDFKCIGYDAEQQCVLFQ